MTNTMPRLQSAKSAAAAAKPAGTRKVSRQPVAGLRKIEIVAEATLPARLTDISTHGCNASLAHGTLRHGQFVSVRLSKEHCIKAIVRWIDGDISGLEFLRPLTRDIVGQFALI
ncbi:PilZ domain-containing protein [Novosphingobium lentum]|uniref:PilZ domain-containing protein n=1 Tax=Novosphingobium lentum TaxID=145287 RepID=UPI000831B97F|nr:PilZ domain-containing protein [Novosphingobium lentum]